MDIMERKVFICDCHSVAHQFVIDYYNDDDDPEVYVSIRLNSFGNVFQRLWRALKYVVKVGEADYSEVILNEDKQKELIKFLQTKEVK
jgi:hypothetical protein